MPLCIGSILIRNFLLLDRHKKAKSTKNNFKNCLFEDHAVFFLQLMYFRTIFKERVKIQLYTYLFILSRGADQS